MWVKTCWRLVVITTTDGEAPFCFVLPNSGVGIQPASHHSYCGSGYLPPSQTTMILRDKLESDGLRWSVVYAGFPLLEAICQEPIRWFHL